MKVLSIRKYLPIAIACFLFFSALALTFSFPENTSSHTYNQKNVSSAGKANSISPKVGEYYNHNGEMKAVWVPFMSLVADDDKYSEEKFKEKFDKIVATSVENKMNTLIVHVRPYGDALYKSKYYPWSHILTGTQGKDPGFDPLEYMLNKTHEEGLEFHAWINPLRIKSADTPKKLSADNLYNVWKKSDISDNTLEWEDSIYLNPAKDEVRKVIIDGVEEIIRNYAVDGIHFDDYFYPTTESEFDADSYNEYISTLDEECVPLTLLEWRSANINKIISGVYSRIKNLTSNVAFGVSPQGNINNDLEMGADVYSWCQTKGYIDYICPQIYVNFEHALLPYDNTANEWRELITNDDIKYYIGLAVYKAGSEEDEQTWLNADDILKKQVEFGREAGADGFMLYSWDYLDNEQTAKEIENVMAVF